LRHSSFLLSLRRITSISTPVDGCFHHLPSSSSRELPPPPSYRREAFITCASCDEGCACGRNSSGTLMRWGLHCDRTLQLPPLLHFPRASQDGRLVTLLSHWMPLSMTHYSFFSILSYRYSPLTDPIHNYMHTIQPNYIYPHT